MKKLTIELAYIDGYQSKYNWLKEALREGLKQLNVDVTLIISATTFTAPKTELATIQVYRLSQKAIDDSDIRKATEDRGEWYIHLLMARYHQSGYLGLMYDIKQDTRERQGCVVFENQIGDNPDINDTKDSKRILLRTTLHEIGHCLDLIHRDDKTIMTQTRDIKAGDPDWISNINYNYADDDKNYVIDHPDESEPGGRASRLDSATSDDPADIDEVVRISFTPFQPETKFVFKEGEPLSLIAKITNKSTRKIELALPLNVNSENVRIWVKYPDGHVKQLQKVISGCGCLSDTLSLSENDFRLFPINLFGDRKGYLFNEPGDYAIQIAVKGGKGEWFASKFQSLKITKAAAVKTLSPNRKLQLMKSIELGLDFESQKKQAASILAQAKEKGVKRALYWNLSYGLKKAAFDEEVSLTKRKAKATKLLKLYRDLLPFEKSPIRKGKIISDLIKTQSIISGKPVKATASQAKYITAYDRFSDKSIKSNYLSGSPVSTTK